MSNITWLHLSDFHFRTDKSPKGKVEDYNRDLVLKKLLDDLRTYPNDNGLKIDFIIITGDIAFSGRKDEYELAKTFFDKLLEIFHIPKNRLFIVPGNHDVDRDKINPYLKPVFDGQDTINGFLMNKEAKELYFKKFEDYREFVNKYFEGDLEFDFDNRYFWAKKFRLEKTGPEIGLLGLNSSWNACGDEDRNNLLIGEKQVRDAIKQIGEADLSIAAFHHPLDWLRDDDKKDIKRELTGKRYQFVLHGHLHESGISCEATPDSSLVTIAAGACYEKRHYSNSYNFLTIDRNTNQATLHLRRYSDSLGDWQADTETFHEAKNGICQIDLKRTSPFVNLSPEPVVTPEAETPPTKLATHFAHSKPLEEYWAGRKDELARLSEWYGDDTVKVIGLVGFGGVGKSALARHWLEEVDADGIFWWCFYHEPNLDAFLLAALDYLSSGKFDPKEATGSPARVRALLGYLAKGRFILVLDGLEEMQAAQDRNEHFGEMKETAFADLLRGCAERNHRSVALITTRFPLKDIQAYEGQTYRRLLPEKLSSEDARELMRNRGVTGEDKALDRTTSDYNYHALSLKLIAGYLKEFFNGDIGKVPQIPFSVLEADKKVAMILSFYHDKLDTAQKAFMAIFSIFRRPVEEDALSDVFCQQISDFDNHALVELNEFDFNLMQKHLINLGLISEDKHGDHIAYSTHPLIRRYYYEHLERKSSITLHRQVAQYYEKKALTNPKNLGDLTYNIEFFHHIIHTEDYDQAYKIYKQQINFAIGTYNFLLTAISGAFELDLNLISNFFPDGDLAQDPLISKDKDKGWLINEVGFDLMAFGELKRAISFFKRFIKISQKNKDWDDLSTGFNNLSGAQIFIGDLKEGESNSRFALIYARKIDSPSQRTEAQLNPISNYAYSKFLMGINKEAQKQFEKAIQLQGKFNPTIRSLFSTRGIQYTMFLFRKGKKELAEEINKENLELCQRNTYSDDIARCYRLQADFYLERQDYDQTKNYLNKGLQIARNIDLQEEIAQLHLGFARLYLVRNELSKANSALKETLSICTHCGYKIIEIDARNVLAQVYQASAQPSLARTEAETALSMSEKCGYHWGKLDARKILDQLSPDNPGISLLS